jgi:hypothetical protein
MDALFIGEDAASPPATEDPAARRAKHGSHAT